jgi:N-acetylneuraminate synthase/N,N'-diacetyllegionaminate synthase
MNHVEIGDRLLGPGQPCFLVAEIGINHNGSLELAHQLIDAAADAGADAVKFQNYRTEDFVTDQTLTHEYWNEGKSIIESQYEMFKRYELTDAALAEFAQHCCRRNILFFSTPTSKTGIDLLVRLGVTLLKNGSDYLVHLPLIRAMARTGLPTLLSTGMATLSEIDDAVRAYREADGQGLVLLHCTSSYPTPADDVHLRKIPALMAAFGCPIGFSDHTAGVVAALGAVTMGACCVEKHFTLDRDLPGPDHWFSSDPAEFKALVDSVRTLERNLGCSTIGPTPSEALGRRDYRLSCLLARDLPAGHELTEADVTFKRPATGLPPRSLDWIVGRQLARDLPAGRILQPGDFR